jgi:subfamily B ATP-binding cassette protein MsbA
MNKEIMTKTLSKYSLWSELAETVKPFKYVFIAGLIAHALRTIIDAGFIYAIRPVLDKGFISLDVHFIKTIPLILFISIITRGVISVLADYCIKSVGRSVVTVLRQRVFNHALRLPADYFDETSSSFIISKILYDTEQVAYLSANSLSDFIQYFFFITSVMAVMFVISWQLTILFLLIAGGVGLIAHKINKHTRYANHQIQENMATTTKVTVDAITGYRAVRLFGAILYENEKFSQALNRVKQANMRVAIIQAIHEFSSQFILAIGVTTVIIVSTLLIDKIQISPGGLVAIIIGLLQLIGPMKRLASINSGIQQGLAGAKSIFDFLEEPIEPMSGQILNQRSKGSILLENVNYAYRNGPQILNNVSCHIRPGEKIALVGPSGSGKSTIASLLMRLYPLQSGCILIDGVNIETFSLPSLREQIAYVSQDITLFNDTVANNIAYGQPNIAIEIIMQAAQFAYAHEFITQLPAQYNTRVGDHGVQLSGGQRQRIAIARAILKNAPILVFDEATSALDTESEEIIQAALAFVMKGRTAIIIAHRLSTIIDADRILVLHKGQIIEQGNHETLMKKNGHYARLIRAQKEMNRSFELLET